MESLFDYRAIAADYVPKDHEAHLEHKKALQKNVGSQGPPSAGEPEELVMQVLLQQLRKWVHPANLVSQDSAERNVIWNIYSIC
ncbi:Biorientation of chromosomes in cell division protein 1-like [Dirofilaria immitis]